MAQTVRANINPDLLVWARKSVGLNQDEAAHKLQVSADRLGSWESGAGRPTIKQLRKAANVYKRPLAVFYLSRVPKHFQPMKLEDFRRLPEAIIGRFSYHLALEVRRASDRRDVVLDLLEGLDERPTAFELTADLAEDPEGVAARARERLNISVHEQVRWRNAYETLSAWKQALERIGVLVFETQHTSRIEIETMRGFSLSEDVLPVIVVNSREFSPRAKVFTLMHELAHLMLRRGGVCDLEEQPGARTQNERTEIFCNHTAGAILLPAEMLLSDDQVRESDFDEWPDSTLAALSRRFSVSREVVLRRLLILGRTTQSVYREKRAEFLKEYKREAEANRKKQAEREGGPSYARLMLRSHGRAYSTLVLTAFHQGVIGLGEVSGLLGMKLKHLPKIEAELFE